MSGQAAGENRAAAGWKARDAAALEHDRQVREGLAAAVAALTPRPPAGHIPVRVTAAAPADGGAR